MENRLYQVMESDGIQVGMFCTSPALRYECNALFPGGQD